MTACITLAVLSQYQVPLMEVEMAIFGVSIAWTGREVLRIGCPEVTIGFDTFKWSDDLPILGNFHIS